LLAAACLLPILRPYRKGALLGTAMFLAVLSPWVLRNNLQDVQSPPSSLMVKALAHGS
jgi:hypothetical protein